MVHLLKSFKLQLSLCCFPLEKFRVMHNCSTIDSLLKVDKCIVMSPISFELYILSSRLNIVMLCF